MITKRQKSTLKKHSPHHTKKHMTEMKKKMSKGKSFTSAHRSAMKKSRKIMNVSIIDWITRLFEPQKGKTPKYFSGAEKAAEELKTKEPKNGKKERSLRKHTGKKKKN
jgi:hypothetical protein